MDLNLLKQKLQQQQTKGQKKTYEKIDYSKIFWKPKLGKQQIRIVPSKFDKDNPFREIYLHYGFSKGPILALTNWKESDPIVEFAKSLRKSSEKEDWQLAKKIEPKLRVFAPVIVRGEEDKGVRLWEFGKKTYEQLLGIATDEDYGDFTDVQEGRDFTVEGTEGEVAGKTVIECAVRVKPKTSPLSTDAEQIKKFLEEQPDILTVNRKYTFEQLKDVLQNWLDPKEEESVPPVVAQTSDEDTFIKDINEPIAPFNLEVKKTNTDKFDGLFND